jgi:hypothetical protein
VPGAPINLGPFTGGMDNWTDQASISDKQLFLIENGEVDTDGSIVSRPAFVFEETVTPHTGVLQPLGYYVRSDGITFLVVATATNTQIYQLNTKAWTVIWSSPAAYFVQYDNKIVMCSETVAGGYWEAGTFTAMATMPLATQIVFYQERFWLFGPKGTANATTIWFSDLNVITPASSIYNFQTGTNFFTVSKGDGQWVTALVADTNALLIFRSNSTYQFTYPNAPGSGTLRPLSKTIGADNKWSIGAYEVYYLVISQGYLYQFINYKHYPLNTKRITFQRGSLAGALLADIRLSIYGRRCILWFYGSIYVYNLITTSWSVWVSAAASPAHFFTIPPTSTSGASRTAIVVTGETDAAKQRLWRIADDPIATGSLSESFALHVTTKSYDFSRAANDKRMTWWALEVQSATGARGVMSPVVIPIAGVTWNQMNSLVWPNTAGGVPAIQTWNNPMISQPTFSDTVGFPTAAPQRQTIKFAGAGRFVRVFADVYVTLDGTSKTSPAKIFSIVPYLKNKVTVSQKVS